MRLTSRFFEVLGTPYASILGDFNGDGRLDLAAAVTYSNNVSVLLGNGDGTFQTPANYPVVSYPYSLAVGDFNGDGKLDLAVANQGSNNVSLLRGNGNGTFQAAVNYPGGTSPRSVTVGDFNGDGKLDLAVANSGTNNVSILLGNGDGTFQTAVNFNVGTSPYSVTSGDFNGDGKLDLAVANSGTDNASILLGNGDGTFQPAVTYAVGTYPRFVVALDFNKDGRLDLATANNPSNNVSFLVGNGDGTFQPALNYGGAYPTAIAVGDFNGDGKPDVAVSNYASYVSILVNARAPSCPTITLSPTVLTPGVPGIFYSQTITASGGTGPYSFVVSGGALPSGLALSSAGTVSGTPTTEGASSFTVTATDTNGNTGSKAYTIIVSSGKAVIVSPTPGSTLTSSSVSFTWSAGSGATEYYLQVGTTVGGQELYSVSEGTNLSATVMALPTNGSTVYVRLWSKIGGLWSYNDYSYVSCTGCTATKAAMTTPAPGSTLSSSLTTFWWSASLGSECYLQVGTTLGGQELYSAGQGTNLSVQVPMLPTNGSPVYARLWTNIGGAWLYNDYTYTACSGCTATKAVMMSPATGSTLTASSVTFTWSASLASQYYLQVGTVPGGQQLYSAGQGTNLSTPVSGLPIGGGNVYVRLWSEVGGAWWYNDYSYVACSGCTPTLASMTTPAPGATLSATMMTFTWVTSLASECYLQVGTTVGGQEIYSAGEGTNLSSQVMGLPNNGGAVYVRLWSKIGGAWLFNDYSYTACTGCTATKAAMVTPAPGSTLSSRALTFTWSASLAAEYYLFVGTTAGGQEIYSAGRGTNLSVQVSGLPNNGSTVHVRLWSRIGPAWLFNDYTYTACSGCQ